MSEIPPPKLVVEVEPSLQPLWGWQWRVKGAPQLCRRYRGDHVVDDQWCGWWRRVFLIADAEGWRPFEWWAEFAAKRTAGQIRRRYYRRKRREARVVAELNRRKEEESMRL